MTSSSTKRYDHVASYGCSLAFGEELVYRNKRYSKMVSQHFGATLVDHSRIGISNEIISQNVINSLLANKHEGTPSRTLVLVEWTFCNRLSFCGKDNRYYVIADYNINVPLRKQKLKSGHDHILFNDDFEDMMDIKFFYDHHTNLAYMLYNMTKHIHHAQMFLQKNGYDFVFLFAGDQENYMISSIDYCFKRLGLDESNIADTYPYFLYMLKDIDKRAICPTSFMGYNSRHNYKVGPFRHPLEEGHLAYSKVLIDFIEKKNGQ